MKLNLSFKSAGLMAVACSLIMLSLNVVVNLSYRDSVSSFLLKYIPEPKPEEQGLPFLSENLILKGDKNTDVLNISIGQNSTIMLTGHQTYSLGEEINVKIILYNARGEKMSRGGDYLRLWMENGKIEAAVSGTVLDNNDGTYSGTVRAMWSGEAVIGAMILGRREEIALIYQLYSKFHTAWYNYAEFTNGKIKEGTHCSVAPYDNRVKWCNLTDDNAGFPWFCVKPKKPGLSCKMWTRTWSVNSPRRSNSSAYLAKLWRQSDAKDMLSKRLLRISGRSDRIISPDTPCNKIAPEVTWNRKPPKGFFYKSQWHSTQCTDTMKHTPTAYKECLRGRTLYLHGDSTSDQFNDYLTKVLKLRKKNGRHYPKIRSDAVNNFTLSWYAHELPFYHGSFHYNKSVNRAQHIVLDKIPSNSRDIIILYLYVHFTLNHPDVFRQHVQRLVQSVQKLISRAPGVTIAVRGPHAFRKMAGLRLLHSYWGLHYMDILHKEFESLQRIVLFIDYWDLTMAQIPGNMHADEKTITGMVQHMMSIICHRK